ncbi:hypothetical protein E2C01_094330 [Portunus trituberculatus]|uniref:Uncharacterized protein n=1 Tax=Portunus trituberculatus TaxID=210409 RepID=A0A5B7JS62_PORTR|nr:hypothetical protein [Portunus trituberculatus]
MYTGRHVFLAGDLEKQGVRGVMSPGGEGTHGQDRPGNLIGRRWPGVVKVLEAVAVEAMVVVVLVAG